ncbi:unnamed protein product [Protopolystoma xenopodis]|uniref:Phorbol-ester/DAG-type domain-containing protein n=1 Tax=Protopolystoma xenopodis TaxID=117903 RepID=A0A3S5CCB0_9PLAT|nr:unnamed protein product [Protopolystoma xenopodis]
MPSFPWTDPITDESILNFDQNPHTDRIYMKSKLRSTRSAYSRHSCSTPPNLDDPESQKIDVNTPIVFRRRHTECSDDRSRNAIIDSDFFVANLKPTNGHHFCPIPLESETFCDLCSRPIFGLGWGPVCLRCAGCHFTCHWLCKDRVASRCDGSLNKSTSDYPSFADLHNLTSFGSTDIPQTDVFNQSPRGLAKSSSSDNIYDAAITPVLADPRSGSNGCKDGQLSKAKLARCYVSSSHGAQTRPSVISYLTNFDQSPARQSRGRSCLHTTHANGAFQYSCSSSIESKDSSKTDEMIPLACRRIEQTHQCRRMSPEPPETFDWINLSSGLSITDDNTFSRKLTSFSPHLESLVQMRPDSQFSLFSGKLTVVFYKVFICFFTCNLVLTFNYYSACKFI